MARAGLAFLCICFAASAGGQSSTRSTSSTITPATGGTGRVDPNSTYSNYEEPQSMRVMRQNARRDDIKKRMEENARRLLLLTAELRADLQTREPTEADSKRLDEIVKLAHAVREQMKQ